MRLYAQTAANPSVNLPLSPSLIRRRGYGTIEGRVSGGRPDQLIVLYARVVRGTFRPTLTKLESDLTLEVLHTWEQNMRAVGRTWVRSTDVTDLLPRPGGGVLLRPLFLAHLTSGRRGGLELCSFLPLACRRFFFRWRQHRLIREMNLRFEQRLAECTRIAQDLHDTLLQVF